MAAVLRAVVALLVTVLLSGRAFGAERVTGRADAAGDTTAAPWIFQAAAYLYFIPDYHDILTPVVTADRPRLHFEARYNYEALDTGSLFAGLNFAGGETLAFGFTAMFGGTFGDVSGLAPAYRGALYWRSFDLSSEGEYLFDLDDSSESFFYMWSELGWSPAEWFRTGLVAQRTEVYQTELEFQRGIHAGVSRAPWDATLYLFNPDRDDPVVVVIAALSF